MIHEKEIDKLDILKLKSYALEKTLLRKMKRSQKLQNIFW